MRRTRRRRAAGPRPDPVRRLSATGSAPSTAARSARPSEPTAVPPTRNATPMAACIWARSATSFGPSIRADPGLAAARSAEHQQRTVIDRPFRRSAATRSRVGAFSRDPFDRQGHAQLALTAQHLPHLLARSSGPRPTRAVAGRSRADPTGRHEKGERADLLRAGRRARNGVVVDLEPGQQVVLHCPHRPSLVGVARRRSTTEEPVSTAPMPRIRARPAVLEASTSAITS